MFGGYCQACQYHFIDHILNIHCDQIPENTFDCGEGETCELTPVTNEYSCELIDFCKDITCRPGRFCENGLCLKIPNYCTSIFDCLAGFIC